MAGLSATLRRSKNNALPSGLRSGLRGVHHQRRGLISPAVERLAEPPSLRLTSEPVKRDDWAGRHRTAMADRVKNLAGRRSASKGKETKRFAHHTFNQHLHLSRKNAEDAISPDRSLVR
jgi:hypothetical protein